MNLSAAELIKVFECCYTDRHTSCDECPRFICAESKCADVVENNLYGTPKAILDLLNRQQAEIERLEKHGLKEAMIFNSDTIKRATTEAVKEFVAKAEEKAENATTWAGVEPVITLTELKKLAKEMRCV